MTTESHEPLAGADTIHVTVGDAPRVTVVILHGYAMRAADLVPFARSLGVAGEFYFPEAPLDAERVGRAWWPIDQERRAEAMAVGPRDLFREHPDGLEAARSLLHDVVGAIAARHAGAPLVLVGFSHGGMLACDSLLRGTVRADGLALLSSSRIAADEWAEHAVRLRGLPVLVSHGERDPDLGFATGIALRDFCEEAGAVVTWLPFPGGHEIPLVVWRGVRRLLSTIAARGV